MALHPELEIDQKMICIRKSSDEAVPALIDLLISGIPVERKSKAGAVEREIRDLREAASTFVELEMTLDPMFLDFCLQGLRALQVMALIDIAEAGMSYKVSRGSSTPASIKGLRPVSIN
jgi:hypothetical protein